MTEKRKCRFDLAWIGQCGHEAEPGEEFCAG